MSLVNCCSHLHHWLCWRTSGYWRSQYRPACFQVVEFSERCGYDSAGWDDAASTRWPVRVQLMILSDEIGLTEEHMTTSSTNIPSSSRVTKHLDVEVEAANDIIMTVTFMLGWDVRLKLAIPPSILSTWMVAMLPSVGLTMELGWVCICSNLRCSVKLWSNVSAANFVDLWIIERIEMCILFLQCIYGSGQLIQFERLFSVKFIQFIIFSF